jgi:flagellar export protein FliJ
MAFKYRLERILSLREQELEEVKSKFQHANQKILQLKTQIQNNAQNQVITKGDLTTKLGLQSPQLYINRLKHLRFEAEKLEQDLVQAEEEKEMVKEELVQAQQKMEALKKHKKKQKQEYEKAELKTEENQLNELALIMRRFKQDENQSE